YSFCFFFSSRRRHTRCLSDWSSDVCSSDLFQWFLFGSASGVIDVPPAVAAFQVPKTSSGSADGLPPCCQSPEVLVGSDVMSVTKIGRASCRERVWIEGGDGSVEVEGRSHGV